MNKIESAEVKAVAVATVATQTIVKAAIVAEAAQTAVERLAESSIIRLSSEKRLIKLERESKMTLKAAVTASVEANLLVDILREINKEVLQTKSKAKQIYADMKKENEMALSPNKYSQGYADAFGDAVVEIIGKDK